MRAWNGTMILSGSLVALGSLALLPTLGIAGFASLPESETPLGHYVTHRSNISSPSRKTLEESDGLVIGVDDFTYTAIIKASAVNPFAARPPAKRPTPKKAALVSKFIPVSFNKTPVNAAAPASKAVVPAAKTPAKAVVPAAKVPAKAPVASPKK